MYYTVVKLDRHLRTQGNCKNREPPASILYISRVLSNVRRIVHLLYDREVVWRKTIGRSKIQQGTGASFKF